MASCVPASLPLSYFTSQVQNNHLPTGAPIPALVVAPGISQEEQALSLMFVDESPPPLKNV